MLLLQRCGDTGRAYFPPRPFSPYTGSRNVSVFEASGQGTLYSYVINQRPAKGFDAPYAIAIVQLPEGGADDDQHRRMRADAGGA